MGYEIPNTISLMDKKVAELDRRSIQDQIYWEALKLVKLTAFSYSNFRKLTLEKGPMLCNDPLHEPNYHYSKNGSMWVMAETPAQKERRGWITKCGRVTEFTQFFVQPTGEVRILEQTPLPFGGKWDSPQETQYREFMKEYIQ